MIAEIGVYLVLVDMDDLHDSALLDEEEVLAFGPGVLEGVAKDLALLQEGLIFLVEFVGNGDFVGGVVTLV
jgi:hypothetical protein